VHVLLNVRDITREGEFMIDELFMKIHLSDNRKVILQHSGVVGRQSFVVILFRVVIFHAVG
jgi:hypothetical protein